MEKNIASIIDKYIKGLPITEEEFLSLKQWLLEDKNKQSFQAYVETHYLLDYKYKTFNHQKAAELFKNHIAITSVTAIKPKRFNYQRLLKYAAVIIAVLGLFFWVKNQFSSPKQIIPENAITIQLDNGDIQKINADGDQIILDKQGNFIVQQEQGVLNYNLQNTPASSGIAKPKTATEKPVYNELKVSYGKTFKLKLFDGTLVHLNAGSSLKYPVKFIKGMPRKVFLKGEGYFNVAKDPDHPFIVNTENLNTIALGTQFNVSSYGNDPKISTVLVEGSLGVYKARDGFDPNTSLIIRPGEKADWDKTKHNLSVATVNTAIYTSWISGRVVFSHTPFNEIIKVLERHYNVAIVNNNKDLAKEVFTASFDTETIEEVFEAFNKTYQFSHHTENNKIIIN